MTIKDPPWLDPAQENNPAPKKNLRKAAEVFIAENPKVYALFVRFAMEMARRNRRFGINLLRERVRWEIRQFWESDLERGFKLNNNHSPYIARKLIEDYPRLQHLIQCRETFW